VHPALSLFSGDLSIRSNLKVPFSCKGNAVALLRNQATETRPTPSSDRILGFAVTELGLSVNQSRIMKKYLLPVLLALGLFALVPQQAKADDFTILMGPAYCQPHPQYYGGYYRRYYYYDNPYQYRQYHRHWRHWQREHDDE
jgi:hypothetical protein